MACTTIALSGITTSCGANVASIKRVIVGKFGSATFTTQKIDSDGGDGAENIEDLTATLASGADNWVELQFRKNSCSANQEMVRNDNGSFYFNNNVTLVFAKEDNDKRLAIQALGAGDCSLAYLDGNNQWWMMGYDAEVTLESTSGTTGTAVSDNNQYDIVLSEASGAMPIAISNGVTTINALLGNVNVGG